ncbi:RluA family pseudouridine synthase [Anaeromyxobacter diazotrophicus]|uniref:Pseudouridine synthase n=1 Tax=Anaeromyxobacter diazotrophicus TaxID=2590199 RepID=A0A7I9VSP2_9BACT|nr:RluA family pseudouridine synthase [Anaeromyxobacter diazotrophicus]GEJ59466.1 pseudouridine synthase [Anaeromyxobacter diazotrophicus]
MRRLTLRVAPADAGARLDRFIAEQGAISRGLARRVLDAGGVFLDGHRCKVASRTVRPGQAVVVNLEESGRAAPVVAALDRARLLYADEHLVAVDKPPFVPAQPTLTTDRGALPELVASLVGAPVTVVHRLDRETSGVTVLARTRAAAAALSEAFRTGQPEKTYLALAARAPAPPDGRLEAPLGPDPARPGRRAVLAAGEPAATRYRTLRAGPSGAALVECRPETGRTHQIRVHLAHLGAPLLGDPRYGGPRRVLETSVPRVLLHARRLLLPHPATGAPLAFEAPLPEDFLAVVRALVPGGGDPAEAL